MRCHSGGSAAGDRVAVLALNGIEYLETVVAVARLGAISVPINFRMVGAEANYVLADSGARALVVGAPLEPLAAASRAGTDGLERACAGATRRRPARAPSRTRTSSPRPPRTTATTRSRDYADAFLMYTSGTTGRPKGAVLSHRNLLMHATSYITHFGVAPDDRTWLAGSPLFHIAGLSSWISYLYLGGHTVLTPSGQFDAAQTVDLLARDGCDRVLLRPGAVAADLRPSRPRGARPVARCAASSGARRRRPPR